MKRKQSTLVCDHYPRLEIIEYSASSSHAEVKRKHLQQDIPHLAVIVTWYFHIINQSMSAVSCHVMSDHMPHHYCGSCILYSKCILKCKSKGSTWNVKSHVSLKFIWSQTVTRVVKESPLVIYTPSLYEQGTFHLGFFHKALER